LKKEIGSLSTVEEDALDIAATGAIVGDETT
jgi:hypothetical protein